jgi:hypothetical protein
MWRFIFPSFFSKADEYDNNRPSPQDFFHIFFAGPANKPD